MVGVAEKLSRRFFSRSQTYHVRRRHKTIIERKRPYQPPDSWVTVHNLRQLDGGILDPDDRLHDVADDREQIIAIYDEATKPQQGDGTSASDESENHSPNIFNNTDHKFEPFSRNGIEITGEELHGTPPPLHVRRGSEPALNRLSPIPPYTSIPLDPSKRWSAAPVIEDQAPPSSTPLKDQVDRPSHFEEGPFEGYPGERGEGSGEEKLPSSSSVSSSASSHHSATTTTLSRFTRDGNRCSVQILSDNPNVGRWAEAADRVIEAGAMFEKESMRREPLGGASTPKHSREHSFEDNQRYSMLVTLNNDGSPLGIHVIPSTDRSGLDQGLLVEGVEPDGRVARDGRIRVHDIIIEINGKPLRNVTFHQAQEIFKDAMKDPELRLLIVKKDSRDGSNKLIHVQERLVSGSSKVANVAHTRKTPSITLSSRTQAVMLQSNTRRIGKRLTVNLVKGSNGLGFSITTRDNPAGGEAPIYIKNILPKGAAIEEGTLRIGDRLLEVNGVQVTGYSQSEVAGLLRQIPIGGVASLIVSRQEKVSENFSGPSVEIWDSNQPPSPKLPRQLPSERVSEDSLMFPWKQREILTFEIPVHDSERAGLGVSVKGKTSSGPSGSIDLGIFVKNVIHGGAASRDGRLRQNDQLVNINGLSLLGKSNSEAMKTLRTAMHQELTPMHQFSSYGNQIDPLQESSSASHTNFNQVQQFVGPTPGKITLTVARRVDGNKRDSKGFGATMNPDHSGTTSEASDNTVIFNSRKDQDLERSVEGCLDYGCSDTFPANNPVIQRLTGNSNIALRNESYYKATHDTWNASQLQAISGAGEKERTTGGSTYDKFSSPTVNLPSRETVLIHDEYDPGVGGRRPSGQSSVVPVSSSGGVYSEQPPQSNDAYVSQTSLEESGVGFSRDQFGRQSMSEKRHATLDAKSTDTYQRNKKAREEREKYRKEMYAEMGLDGDTRSSKNPTKGIREVPVDVPSSSPIKGTPSSPSDASKETETPALDTNLNEKPSTQNQFNKAKPIYTKNKYMTSPALERLKCLAKFTDLKSYTGKSLTLQPSSIQRPSEAKSPLLRSLRNPPGQTSVDLRPSKPRRASEGGESKFADESSRVADGKLFSKNVPPKSVIGTQDKEIKKGPRTTFGQDLSAIIHSWVARNPELLRHNPSRGDRLHRANSDDFLSSNFDSRRQNASLHHSIPRGNTQASTRGMSKSGKEVGPGLGMRKSSSLESLQTMVQEMALEDEAQRAGSGRVPRGRGCNESFRAAVDRSYDAPLSGATNQMETHDGYRKCYVAEEESESSGSGFGRGNSRQSSLSSSAEEKQRKGNKKRQGIFKGLGSMFRFGKHRKSLDTMAMNLTEEERMQVDKGANSQLQHGEQSLCNMSGVTLPDDEGQSRAERMHQLRAEHQRRHAQRNGTYPTDDIEERYDHVIKQVLGEPNDQQEDKANNNTNSETLASTNKMEMRMDSLPPEPKAEIKHLRSRSYDYYGNNKGNRRPGGFADPNQFSHYENYEQIQMHLRKYKEQERLAKLASQQYQDFRDKQTRKVLLGDDIDTQTNLVDKLEQTFIHESILVSREQREYQSQRCARENTYQQRPVSNYFEYESVQAVMNHAQGNQHTSTASLPRRPQQPVLHHPTRASNSQPGSSQLEHPQRQPPPPMVNSQSSSSGPSKSNKNLQGKNHPQGRIVHPQPLFSHSRGQPPPPPPQMGREGVYAASGFRPASQYNQFHTSINHNHTTLTVPGSKV